MAYTIPSSWQNIDGTHHVAPRAPIVGGDTGDYAFDGLIQDHHLVRADRMTCALSMGNADGWTNTNGPGAGVADWPTFGKSKFETQDGFDGQLDVIVWAKDCEAGGGVYVAVFNTSGTLQTSLTLTNTATATKEELTGSLTGLSASTEYQLEVRFAASASSTPVATLYGVVVTPRALTAANIDDKLDDSRANDDESASSLVPFLIRQNLIASMRERMPHCTTALPEFGNINAPKVSTQKNGGAFRSACPCLGALTPSRSAFDTRSRSQTLECDCALWVAVSAITSLCRRLARPGYLVRSQRRCGLTG